MLILLHFHMTLWVGNYPRILFDPSIDNWFCMLVALHNYLIEFIVFQCSCIKWTEWELVLLT